MTLVALTYLLTLTALVGGMIAAPDQRLVGWGWMLVVLAGLVTGITLAVAVIA